MEFLAQSQEESLKLFLVSVLDVQVCISYYGPAYIAHVCGRFVCYWLRFKHSK